MSDLIGDSIRIQSSLNRDQAWFPVVWLIGTSLLKTRSMTLILNQRGPNHETAGAQETLTAQTNDEQDQQRVHHPSWSVWRIRIFLGQFLLHGAFAPPPLTSAAPARLLRRVAADTRADRLQRQRDGWPRWELPDRSSARLKQRGAGRRIDFHLCSAWWRWNRYQGWCCEERGAALRGAGMGGDQGVKRRKECSEITGGRQSFMMEKVRVVPEMWSRRSGKKEETRGFSEGKLVHFCSERFKALCSHSVFADFSTLISIWCLNHNCSYGKKWSNLSGSHRWPAGNVKVMDRPVKP